jgi:2OG-Fe(II) oxygenase superfamily
MHGRKLALKRPELFPSGFYLHHFGPLEDLKALVLREDWSGLDEVLKLKTTQGGDIFLEVQKFHEFDKIEFMISIRDSIDEWQEDGIWHDDGSRVFAFSLSLTLDPSSLEGGKLGIRKKGQTSFHEISTPPFGTAVLFLTGQHSYEHKIHQVQKGRRIIIAGWCS